MFAPPARQPMLERTRQPIGEDRIVELCPRALEVLNRQLSLRDRMKLEGRIHHENVFFRDDGSQIRNLNDPYDNWRASVERLKIRYREPKNARHSCVRGTRTLDPGIMRPCLTSSFNIC